MKVKITIASLLLVAVTGYYKFCVMETLYYRYVLHAKIATDFNIRPENGGTFNAQKFGELIHNHMAEGGLLYFPCGVYVFDVSKKFRMTILPSNITLTGQKGKSILKIENKSIKSTNTTTNREEIILLGNALDTERRSKNIRLKNLVFDGNFRHNQQIEWEDVPILYFANTDSLTIENCIALNGVGMGIQLVYCQNSFIRDNHIFDIGQHILDNPAIGNADAIQLNGCQNSIITGNNLENVGEGIYCQHWATPDSTLSKNPVADKNAHISRNTIKSLEVHEVPSIKSLLPAYFENEHLSLLNSRDGKARGGSIGVLSQNSDITNNVIQKHSSIIVAASNNHGNLPTYNILIKDNTISKHNIGSNLSNGAITIYSDSQVVKNIRIVNNSIKRSYSSGIELRNQSWQNCTIDNILIDSNQIYSACEKGTQGCAYVLIKNTLLTGNTISSCYNNCQILNNQLSDNNEIYRFWIEKPNKSIKITGNNSTSTAAYMLNLATGSCIHTYNSNIPALNSIENQALQNHLEGGIDCSACSQ